MENEDAPDAEVGAQRVARDIHDHLPVNDYVSSPAGTTSTQDGGHFHQPPTSLSISLPLSLHINRPLIDVKTNSAHPRARRLLYISV